MGSPQLLRALRAAAEEAGARAFLVGGFVRDRLLGAGAADADLDSGLGADVDVVVEDGRGQAMAEAFARAVGARPPVVFPRFGTAQVTVGGALVEFASARAESYAPDSRKPAVRPATVAEDQRRRDFTVNTLLMDLDGEVLDPLGRGLPDLEARVLRTPLDPERTFDDDPLRMLRAIRFAAQLGFQLDDSLVPAMRRLRERARPPVVSVERTREELQKMLVSPRPALALGLLDEAELLAGLLPEIQAMKGIEQRGYHTADVFGHTLAAVAAAPGTLRARLAALFHDVGKPVTAAGDGTFVGHDVEGAPLAEAALRRLRFSNQEAQRVAALVRLHMRPVYYEAGWSDAALRRLARDAGPLLDDLLDLARADIAASAYPHPEKIEELAARLRALLEAEPERVRPQVSGEDIMRELGLPAGPAVGRTKRRLEELVLEGRLDPDRDSVLAYLRGHSEDLVTG